MKEIESLLRSQKKEAKNLMQNLSSSKQRIGLGMMTVIVEVQSALRSKAVKRFLNKENTIVKDGYVYVKINDIPFGNV